jgi:hypothetical protein
LKLVVPACLALLTALALPAAAGDEANPEITDPAGDAGPAAGWGDITAGWLNETATEVTGVLVFAQLTPQVPPGYNWFVTFDVVGQAYAMGAGVGPDGAVAGWYSTWDSSAGPTDIQTGPAEVSGTQLTLHIPKDYAFNGTNPARITGITASSGQLNPVFFAPLAAPVPLPAYNEFDGATGADYNRAVAPGTTPAPTPGAGGNTTTPGTTPGPGGNATTPGGNTTTPPPPPAATPGLEMALVAGGVAAAAIVARRRRA